MSASSNATSNDTGDVFPKRSEATIIAQWLSLAVLGVVIVFGNIASIITFVKTPSLRKKPHYLIISLSVADLFVGLTDFMATYYFSSEKITLLFIMSLDVIDHLSAVASLLTLAMIAVERFVAVNYPFHHRRLQCKDYVILISLPWVAAVVSAIFNSLSVANIIGINICKYLTIILPALALVIITFSYIGIGVKTCQKSPQVKKQAARDRKLVVTLLIVTVASLVTWLPHQMFYIVSFFCKTCQPPSLELLFGTKFLQFLNSGLNVFIYITRIPEFRKAFIALLCGEGKFKSQEGTRNVKAKSSGIGNGGFGNDEHCNSTKSPNGKDAGTKLQELQPESLDDTLDSHEEGKRGKTSTSNSNVERGASKPGQKTRALKRLSSLETADLYRWGFMDALGVFMGPPIGASRL